MVDINTITISGTVTGKVETFKRDNANVAWFQLAVLSADDIARPNHYKIVAFGDVARFCEHNLVDCDPVIILGKLETKRLAKEQQEVQIHPKLIIPIREKEKDAEPDFRITPVE